MLAHRTGTAVAVWLSVRAPFLAWIILAVLLLVAGHLTHAADTETSKVWRSTERAVRYSATPTGFERP